MIPFTRIALIGGLWLALSSPLAHAAEYYVSTSGNNSNSGSLAAPWRTVSKAASTASAGDTVYVRGGTYLERVTHTQSGTAANRITIRNFPDETPVLDGSGQSVGGQTAMLYLNGADHVTYQGFEIRDLGTTSSSQTPIGVLVKGAAIGLEIVDCHIHNITNTNSGGNAHGMLISGNNSTAISDIEIRDCLIEDLLLGNSEALAVNGNVDGFVVTGNTVRNCNNIGIDFIGHERTNGNASLDQARNGVCSNNLVYDCSSRLNPSYGFYSAGGIYVDGGRDIIIERNRVYQCDIGVEIAAEAPGKATSRITVRDNVLWRNHIGGIFTGGYDPGRGSTDDCVITGNTGYQNDTQNDGNGELYIRYSTDGLDVWNNIFYAGSQNLVVSRITTQTSDLDFDYNVYYAPFGGEWSWGNTNWFSGFNNWKNTSGGDANSTYANPGFASTSGAVDSFDLRITSSSPAYNAGDPSFVPDTDQIDAYGNPRVSSDRVDAGAHEVIALSELEQWRLSYFGTNKDVGDAADLADPDGDGQTNLEEFAFGTEPTHGSPSALMATGEGTLSFSRNTSAGEEITYTLQSSHTLAAGSWSTIATRPAGGSWSTIADISVSDSAGAASFTDSRPASGGTYYHVVISR